MSIHPLFAAGLLAASLLAGAAQAAPFGFEYNDTVANIVDLPGVSPGQAVKITVTLDNGGSSVNSQTWTAANLTSVTFDVNNGSETVTFNSPFGGGLNGTAGNFVTNASGILTSVMSDWEDTSIGTDYTTNVAGFPTAWFLNGFNGVWYINNGTRLRLTNVGNMLTASNWSLVQGGSGSAVPEIDAASSTGALTLLLGALGLVAERRRKVA